MKYQVLLVFASLAGLLLGVNTLDSKELVSSATPYLNSENMKILESGAGGDLKENDPNTENSKKPDESTSDQQIQGDDVPSYCSSETFKVKNKADINKIVDCVTVLGDIEIFEFEDALIQFGSIQNIVGSLIIKKSPNLVRIEAPNVTSIGKSFSLRELTSLSLISFPSLNSVKILDWKVLPILSNVNFNNFIENIESIVVSDTSLVGFSGFMVDKLEMLDISNNRFLDTITSNVEKINGKLHIAANAKDVNVNLPKLKAVSNVSIHDVANIDLGSLEEITSSASISNNFFNNLKLPKLMNIGGTLNLQKNEKLSQVEFPNLNEIGGGLMIVNNTHLEKINFFPKLNSIGGALDLVGNIKEASLKNLKLVKGSARLKSMASSFDCAKWTRSEISSVIRGGKIECTNSKNENILTDTSTDGISKDNDMRHGNGQTKFGFRQNSSGNSLFKKNKVLQIPYLLLLSYITQEGW